MDNINGPGQTSVDEATVCEMNGVSRFPNIEEEKIRRPGDVAIKTI